MTSAIDSINLKTMRDAVVVSHYLTGNELLAHEAAALAQVAAEFRGAPVLDIGVGSGRTVEPLRSISEDYLGVDYSPEMVAACRSRYPGVRFEHADARSLSLLSDGSIALAVFSCNGISMVSHEDRLKILHQVHRVLKPGGVFVFTTYNLNSPEAKAGFRFPEFTFSANPLRLLVRLARFVRDTAISLRQRRQNLPNEIHAADYAVINDRWHNYGVMLYYTTLANQRRQLAEAGFTGEILALDSRGQPIAADTNLDSMALIARKG